MAKTFTHSELRDYVAEEFTVGENTKLTKKEADNLVKMIFDKMANEVIEGNDVKMLGVGTIKRVSRKARIGRNPQNPEETINIPAHYAVKLNVEKSLKEKLKALPEPEIEE